MSIPELPSVKELANGAPGDFEVIRRTAHSLNYLAEVMHSEAKAKGWWETDRAMPELLALMHSELSEALEHYREKGLAGCTLLEFDNNGKPIGIGSELADTIIRALDTCGRYGIPIGEILFVKYMYNRTRPRRHGDKHA